MPTLATLFLLTSACAPEEVPAPIEEEEVESPIIPTSPSLANCAVTIESDTNIDGYVNVVRLTRYDDRAHPLSMAIDQQADGVVDLLQIWAYRHDDQLHSEEVRDKDGEVMRRKVYDYDDAGRLIRQETYFPDQDRFLNRTEFEYDEWGYVNRQTLDELADGDVDIIQTWTRDESGRILSGTYENVHIQRCDFPYEFENTWNDLGQLVEVETRYFYPNEDAVYATREETFSYDDAGGRILAEEVYNGDLVRQEFWIRNERGQVRVHQSDWHDEQWNNRVDGNMDAIETFAYNDRGYVIRHDADNNGDGRLDWRITHEYNQEGRLSHTEQDTRANGLHHEPADAPDPFETSIDYTYVCN